MRHIFATCFGVALTVGAASLGSAMPARAASHAVSPAQDAPYTASPAATDLLQPVQYRPSPRERARMRERERIRMAQRRRYLSRH